MANTKISQLPIWSGTAADLRWFVMNNSGQTETFKFSGYTSPFRFGDGTNAVVGAYLPTSRATGSYSLVGGEGTTTSANDSSIVWGKNLNVGAGGEPGKAVFGTSHTASGGGNNLTFGSNCNHSAYYSICGGEGSTNSGNNSAVFGYNNNNAAGRSGIFNGTSNTIVGGSNSFIGGGSNNSINTLGTGAIIGSENSQISENSRNGIYSCYQGIMNFSPIYQSIMMASAYASMTYATASAMIGGFNNTMNGSSNTSSVMLGGDNNTVTSGGFAALLGGKYNIISGGTNYSSIVGGLSNTNAGNYSGIFNGTLNEIINTATEYSTIVGSYSSKTEGDYSHIFGGIQNKISCPQAIIFGGRENSITSGCDNSEMMGSRLSTISGNSVDTTFINAISSNSGGYDRIAMISTSGRTATRDDATFVENLVVFNYANLDFNNDAAAAAGGVVLGQIYHNNGAMRIRTT